MNTETPKAMQKLFLIWGLIILGSPVIAQSPAGDNAISLESDISVAINHYKTGNYRMALVTVKGALLRQPGNPRLKLLGGIMEMRLKDFEQAHAFFCEAIEDGMDRGALYYNRGLCNLKNQQWQWAVNDFTVAIERPTTVDELIGLDQAFGEHSSPADYRAMPYIKRAHALAAMSNIEAAVSDITHAATLLETPGFDYYHVRGLIQYSIGEFEDSIRSLAEAEQIGLQPDHEFYRLYGLAALDVGNYELAIARLHKSLELNKDQSLARRSLAIAYSLNDQNDKALELMGVNLLKQADQGMVYYDLGYLHHLNGKTKLAHKFFHQAVDIQEDVLDMMERFTELTVAPQSSLYSFHVEGLKVARFYIRHKAPPREAIPEEDPLTPRISIVSVTSSPDPVAVEKPFELVTNFKATVPFTQMATLSFHFTIHKDGKFLFQSEPTDLKAERGRLTNWTQFMMPVRKAGDYKLTVYLGYLDVTVQKSALLHIE